MKKILIFLFLFIFCNVLFSEDWYDSNYKNRLKVTIDHTKVVSDLVDFPFLITESNIPDNFWNNVQSDGSDILVTKSDGISVLYRELVYINISTKKIELWINSYALSSSSDTVIYIYFNNASATNSNSTATWDSNYKVVYHLQSDANNSSQLETDGLAISFPSYTAGKIGKSYGSDGNDAIDTNISNIINLSTDYTISFWTNPSSFGSSDMFVYQERLYTSYGTSISHNSSNKVVLGDSQQNAVTSTNALTDDVFSYVSVTSDDSDNKVYMYTNTSLTTGNSKFVWVYGYNNVNNHPMQMGRYWVGTLKGGYFTGLIDEFRVSSVSRSNGYEMTSYNNQNSPLTFYQIIEENNSNSKLIFIMD